MAKRCKVGRKACKIHDQEEAIQMRYLLHVIISERNTNDPNQETKLKRKLIFWRTFWKMRSKGGSGSRVQYPSKCFKLVLMFLDRGSPSKVPLNGWLSYYSVACTLAAELRIVLDDWTVSINIYTVPFYVKCMVQRACCHWRLNSNVLMYLDRWHQFHQFRNYDFWSV